MQPYFFPYIGYFDLINQADLWIVFDTAQYMRGGWVNRNRILHPKQGWQYIGVPYKHADLKTPICEIQVFEDGRWREKLIGQLQHYKREAPHFYEIQSIVSTCVRLPTNSLSQLNIRCLEEVCKYLGIRFEFILLSEMGLDTGTLKSPGDRILRILRDLAADEYINPPGGTHLYDRAQFNASGIKLTIQSAVEYSYDCGNYQFEPNLSIIDVMMWNSPEDICSFFASRHFTS